jgi:hypothetical protein
MRTTGDSWSGTIPGVSAVERRRNLGGAHYCAPLGDAGRRFRPVVISAGGNELRYLSPLSTSIRVLLPSLTAWILPTPNNSYVTDRDTPLSRTQSAIEQYRGQSWPRPVLGIDKGFLPALLRMRADVFGPQSKINSGMFDFRLYQSAPACPSRGRAASSPPGSAPARTARFS